MPHAEFPLSWSRAQFPALRRTVNERPVAFFDGPSGSQVPQSVIDAVTDYMAFRNANRGGLYATGRESDALVDAAHDVVADLVGAPSGESIIFGGNMTTLTFALSRALCRSWKTGDEIIVTRLDHDANVTPWVLAARDAGATVRLIDFDPADCTLRLDQFRAALTSRTRLVALGCASNICGTINPIREICQLAQAAGAQVFLDAVHYTPHALPDVAEWGCDWMACSAYKFFGPHVGVLYGRKELLTSVIPYKLRPVTETLPGRWMTGTQNFEGIAGTRAAVDYLEALGRQIDPRQTSRRAALRIAYDAIAHQEGKLLVRLMDGLRALAPQIKVLGITDPARFSQRTPTISFVHREKSPAAIAQRLGEAGLFVGNGNFYALQWTEAFGLEPQGVVRVGLMHYNTEDEVDWLIEELRRL